MSSTEEHDAPALDPCDKTPISASNDRIERIFTASPWPVPRMLSRPGTRLPAMLFLKDPTRPPSHGSRECDPNRSTSQQLLMPVRHHFSAKPSVYGSGQPHGSHFQDQPLLTHGSYTLSAFPLASRFTTRANARWSGKFVPSALSIATLYLLHKCGIVYPWFGSTLLWFLRHHISSCSILCTIFTPQNISPGWSCSASAQWRLMGLSFLALLTDALLCRSVAGRDISDWLNRNPLPCQLSGSIACSVY